MPHVILSSKRSIEDLWHGHAPFSIVESPNRYKAEEAYLSALKDLMLVRCMTIERGFTKTFYVRVLQKEGGVNVGLDLLSPPDKSDGVKRIIGLVAWHLLQSEPGAEIVVTNIREFTAEPKNA